MTAAASALPADLAPARVTAACAARGTAFGTPYEPHALCGSTNELAAQRAREGAPEGLVVLADRQSGGKGQKGRRWLSPAGENLLFSLVLRPPCPIAELPPLTLLAGVATARVLAGRGVRPRLKWPNDVLVDGSSGPRKLAGILTEMATLRDEVKHVVLGIGLNVNQTSFAPEVADLAGSLASETGRVHDRGEVLAELLAAIETAYVAALAAGPASFLPDWRAYAALPRPCTIMRPGDAGVLVGTAVDVAADGALIVHDGAHVHRVVSGELSPR